MFVKRLTKLKLDRLCEEEQFFELVLSHVSEYSELCKYGSFSLKVLFDCLVNDSGVVYVANT